jgi:hypothetical protein
MKMDLKSYGSDFLSKADLAFRGQRAKSVPKRLTAQTARVLK